MAQIGPFQFEKHVSDNHPATVRAATVAAVEHGTTVGRRCLSGYGGIGRRLVRKLKKQSKLLCSVAGGCLPSGNAAPLHCQYDPLSYSRNFDGCCALDDDSSHFNHTFSSRFARPLAATH